MQNRPRCLRRALGVSLRQQLRRGGNWGVRDADAGVLALVVAPLPDHWIVLTLLDIPRQQTDMAHSCFPAACSYFCCAACQTTDGQFLRPERLSLASPAGWALGVPQVSLRLTSSLRAENGGTPNCCQLTRSAVEMGELSRRRQVLGSSSMPSSLGVHNALSWTVNSLETCRLTCSAVFPPLQLAETDRINGLAERSDRSSM